MDLLLTCYWYLKSLLTRVMSFGRNSLNNDNKPVESNLDVLKTLFFYLNTLDI